jgi:hypothetical protein
MVTPRFRKWLAIAAALTAVAAFPVAWYEIDRADPFVYQAAWFESLPAPGEKIGHIITEAAPGETVILALKLKWLRPNCATELERTFIGSDKVVYKVPRAEGEPARLGPPPAQFLDQDGMLISRRRVVLPPELPEGTATHSPNVWERCTSPAQKLGDYLTEWFPIYIGPKGADAKILIKR